MRRRRTWFWAAFFVILLSPLVLLHLGLRRLVDVVQRDRPRNLLLVTIDTLRADRLGCQGHPGAQTMLLDRLARLGVQFSQAWSPLPITNPAHCSLMSGRHPQGHGVFTNGYRLSADVPLLAEYLAERGLRTGAFVSGFSLARQVSGLERGFEVYDDGWTRRKVERRAPATVAAALRWLERIGDDPFFLWVHLFDPHSPYAPERPFDRLSGPPPTPTPTPRPEVVERYERFAEQARAQGAFNLIQKEGYGTSTTPELLAANLRAYDGEIAFTDRALQRLIRRVLGRPAGSPSRRSPGQGSSAFSPETLVVVTADHGEGFDHDYYYYHGDRVYESALHVPLIVLPHAARASTRLVDAPVSLVDLLPTMATAFGFAPEPGTDGVDLWPAISGGARPAHAYVFARAPELPRPGLTQGPLLALRSERWKLIRHQRDGSLEAYDLERDPGELRDLGARPRAFPPRLPLVLDEWGAAGAHRPPQEPPELDEESREALRQLGYVQ
jgi:arylsulfatase A-like enzyme